MRGMDSQEWVLDTVTSRLVCPIHSKPGFHDFAGYRKQIALANVNDYFDEDFHDESMLIQPRSHRVELEIVRGRAKNRIRPVNVPVFLIGSATDCDLVLGDPDFPGTHTYLFIAEDRVTLRHLGLSPQLIVEGEPVDHAVLGDGQSFQLGNNYAFRIHIRSEAGDAPTQPSRVDEGAFGIDDGAGPVPPPKGRVVRERIHALLAEIRDGMDERQVLRQWNPATFSIRQLLVYASTTPSRASA